MFLKNALSSTNRWCRRIVERLAAYVYCLHSVVKTKTKPSIFYFATWRIESFHLVVNDGIWMGFARETTIRLAWNCKSVRPLAGFANRNGLTLIETIFTLYKVTFYCTESLCILCFFQINSFKWKFKELKNINITVQPKIRLRCFIFQCFFSTHFSLQKLNEFVYSFFNHIQHRVSFKRAPKSLKTIYFYH